MKTKKKNPQDLTSRNNDARKKEINKLHKRLLNLETVVMMLIEMMSPTARKVLK